jgi:hypothetical protein
MALSKWISRPSTTIDARCQRPFNILKRATISTAILLFSVQLANAYSVVIAGKNQQEERQYTVIDNKTTREEAHATMHKYCQDNSLHDCYVRREFENSCVKLYFPPRPAEPYVIVVKHDSLGHDYSAWERWARECRKKHGVCGETSEPVCDDTPESIIAERNRKEAEENPATPYADDHADDPDGAGQVGLTNDDQ